MGVTSQAPFIVEEAPISKHVKILKQKKQLCVSMGPETNSYYGGEDEEQCTRRI
jgi:hypothetical protein